MRSGAAAGRPWRVVLGTHSSSPLGRAGVVVELRAGEVVEHPARRLPAQVAGPLLSAVPDVLAPRLRAIFCGINPGRASAAAGAHFANPRNDFWRLLADAGLTPRQLAPTEQHELIGYGYGLTNAARRTTRGSSELRRADFAGSDERIQKIADELWPLVIAFVGKAAYEGTYRERPQLGLQTRRLSRTLLFVLPSTSPANAAVPYQERLRWFSALHELLHPPPRHAVRALLLDAADRVLLFRFVSPGGVPFWAAPGGGVEADESDEEAMERELAEEVGLRGADLGPCVWTRRHVFTWHHVVDQADRFYLVRVDRLEVAPELDLSEEGVDDHRWWTLAELEQATEELAPRHLPVLLRDLLEHGAPPEPVDVGV